MSCSGAPRRSNQLQPPTYPSVDIHVYGAGCLGLGAALALAEDGHDVTVIDPNGVGAGASGKAAGIVSTMTWNDDDFHLVQQTRGRLGALIAEAQFDVPAAEGLWRSHDSLTIAKGEQLRTMDDIQHRVERLGEETDRLDHRQAAAAFPDLHFEPGEEVLVAQEDGYVEAGDLCTVLAWAAEEEGANIVRESPGKPEATVLAMGAWTPAELTRRGISLPMAPFRVQAASISMPGAVPIVHDIVNGCYFRPESANTILAGDGTRLWPHDPEDYDEAADTEFRDSIAERLVRRIAAADQATWRRGWAGLVVGTADRRPVCGPVADDLHVLSGDNGFGIMRCIGLGRRLADAVDGDVRADTAPARFDGFKGEWELQEGFGW